MRQGATERTSFRGSLAAVPGRACDVRADTLRSRGCSRHRPDPRGLGRGVDPTARPPLQTEG